MCWLIPMQISIFGNWIVLELLELQFKISCWAGLTPKSHPVQSNKITERKNSQTDTNVYPKGILLRKPNKPNYSIPKAYRVISLLERLGKVGEKPVATNQRLL